MKQYGASLLAGAMTLVVLSASLPVVCAAVPPNRDHLTDKEVERVQEAQLIDLRVGVFIHAIERRIGVLNNSNPQPTKQEIEKWGELPKGTKAELLSDIAAILDEAITNIDDVSSREDANKKLLDK